MKELNFNDIDEKSLIDDLTYSNVVYNVEEYGMSWEGVKTLFPEQYQLIRERYEEEIADGYE